MIKILTIIALVAWGLTALLGFLLVCLELFPRTTMKVLDILLIGKLLDKL